MGKLVKKLGEWVACVRHELEGSLAWNQGLVKSEMNWLDLKYVKNLDLKHVQILGLIEN